MLQLSETGSSCRIEEALFFANGSVTLIQGTPDTGYTAGSKLSFHELVEGEPDGWADIYETCQAENSEFLATAGETSFGGEGYIALYNKMTNQYLWLVHFWNSNNFVEIEICGESIIANSDYHYPQGTRFVMPIVNPICLEVGRRK